LHSGEFKIDFIIGLIANLPCRGLFHFVLVFLNLLTKYIETKIIPKYKLMATKVNAALSNGVSIYFGAEPDLKVMYFINSKSTNNEIKFAA
jgi:hypothetical protein